MLSTHYMDEAEALADLVGSIIGHGHLLVEDRPRQLFDQMGTNIQHSPSALVS